MVSRVLVFTDENVFMPHMIPSHPQKYARILLWQDAYIKLDCKVTFPFPEWPQRLEPKICGFA